MSEYDKNHPLVVHIVSYFRRRIQTEGKTLEQILPSVRQHIVDAVYNEKDRALILQSVISSLS
jgi:hypothetical protein